MVRKKIIKVTQPKESIVINDTQNLLNDAKMIVAADLAKYRSKTSRGASLDLKEARVVQGYIDALSKLLKEEREQARSEDLGNMTNDELLALAEKVFSTSKPELNSKSKIDVNLEAPVPTEQNAT